MSREILFRGKTVKDNKWVYGYLYQDVYDDKKDSYIIEDIANINEWFEGNIYFHEIKTNTFDQYTGLKDKNGAKIFEWDIAKDSNNKIWTVCYDNEYAMFSLVSRDGDIMNFSELSFSNIEIEVIGNIHDNPELLERRVK